jgi:putative addiction module component (TIGR02574 family)
MGYSESRGGSKMTRAAKDIVEAAIQLPENERVQVVEQLMVSLEPESDEDVDSAWVAEIERRSRQIKEGTVSLIPWEEVKSQARKRARAKK